MIKEIFLFAMAVLLLLGVYTLGWINCRQRARKILREALRKHIDNDHASYERGWLDCLDFLLKRFQ